MTTRKFNAVVLAGDRGANDPLVISAKVAVKAEVSIGGVMQLERVLMALAKADCIDKIFVVGPDKCHETEASQVIIDKYGGNRLPIADGPSASALLGLEASAEYPTLIITCDLPLITDEYINLYCQQISSSQADFVVSAVPYQLIANNFPELKKTVYDFSEVSVCFANVFSVMTPQGKKAVDFWREMEALRKKPLQIISKLGWRNILAYKVGCLHMTSVAKLLSRQVNAEVIINQSSYTQLAIDVDSEHDYQVMCRYLQ